VLLIPVFQLEPFLATEQLVAPVELQAMVELPPDCTRAGLAVMVTLGECTLTVGK
jgi:hypothetical protein